MTSRPMRRSSRRMVLSGRKSVYRDPDKVAAGIKRQFPSINIKLAKKIAKQRIKEGR